MVQLKFDIRDGFDFGAYREWLEGNNRFNKRCPTGNASLRSLWADFRENLEPYGLGKIHSLEPIESNAEAIGRYVGKYISKHIGNRTEEQKGVRLVNYSRGWLRNSVKFAWNTDNAFVWRRKLAKYAASLGCTELYQLNEKLGPGWVYKYLDDIIAIEITTIERLVNDKAEGFIRKVPEFKSNTIKKANLNKKLREKSKTDLNINESHRLSVEKKKQETKCYMSKLKPEYVENWLPENSHEYSLEDQIKETMESHERLSMMNRQYSYKESIDKKTGEVIPF